MFDVILRDDLLNLNKADNINDLSFNRKEMIKILENKNKKGVDMSRIIDKER